MHFKRDRYDRRVMESRVAETSRSRGEENINSVNGSHGVDFMKDVIPGMIEKLKRNDNKRKLKILDLGCGFGFFNDQLRARFRDGVDVYGTALVKTETNRRKSEFYDKIKNGVMLIDTTKREQLLQELKPQLHQNDAKWRSVMEMSEYPEFDLIIDTSGEMLYAQYADEVFRAAIHKLQRGGLLYSTTE